MTTQLFSSDAFKETPLSLQALQGLHPSQPLRFALTGGGTGGHLYPALAVAEALQTLPYLQSLLYLGDARRLEAQKVPEAGLPFVGMQVSGMPRSVNVVAWVRWLWEMAAAIKQAKQELETFKPHAVLATGGYVSAPVLFAAKLLGLPVLLHEPDAAPGLVNKLLAPFATQVTGAFEAAGKKLNTRHFKATGNPLRLNLGHLAKAEGLAQLGLAHWHEERPVLLVLGGSLGARTLNQAVIQGLNTWTNELGFAVIHQTGAKLYDETLQALGEQAHNPAYCVQPFFDNMPAVWACGHVVLCRAGSLTLSEVSRAGLPSILVPYPYAAANHQWHNGKAMEVAKASWLLEDSACSAKQVTEKLILLAGNPPLYEGMKEATLRLSKPHATEDVVCALLKMASLLQ